MFAIKVRQIVLHNPFAMRRTTDGDAPGRGIDIYKHISILSRSTTS